MGLSLVGAGAFSGHLPAGESKFIPPRLLNLFSCQRSWIAVNHIANWNPNYRIERLQSAIDLAALKNLSDTKLVTAILDQLGETGEVKGIYRADKENLQIFVVNNNITANLVTGAVHQEKNRPRKVLYEMNFLHINHAKKLWTWMADLYAVALALVAVTGLFVLRGKNGISGRGAWLTGTGIIIHVFWA